MLRDAIALLAGELGRPTEPTTEILRVLHGQRFPLNDEKATQVAIAEAFTAAGVAFEREVRLRASDIIDFRCGRVGIEVKLAGAPRAIYRQCCRYLESPDIDALVLATARSVSLPAMAKPVVVVSLSRAWL